MVCNWTISPLTLSSGLLQTADSKVFIGLGNGTIKDLTTSSYIHPSAQQCTIPLATSNSNGLMSAADKVKLDELIEGSKYGGLISGSIELGNTVAMGGYIWLVCHIDEVVEEFYLIINKLFEEIEFSSGGVNYASSIVAERCETFLGELPEAVQNLLLVTYTEGVNAKIFIPTYDQMNGGFSWFNSDERRIADRETGISSSYWLSTKESTKNIYLVSATSGSIGSTQFVERTYAFRPACRIKLE